jgi:hypothetical protein
MKISKLILLFSGFLPACMMAGLVIRYGVNVPHWDQWDTPAIQLIEFAQGNLSITSLLAQHNEGRPFFPRLFFIGLAQLGGWHVKREMFFTLALAGLVSVGLLRLSRQTLPISSTFALGLWAATNWLLFSPAQWDNWFWGFQVATLVPIACVVAGLLILNRPLHPGLKFFSCGALATLSSFSFANGLLAWLVLLPSIYAAAWGKSRQWLMPIGWIVWATLAGIAYFYNYQSPQGHPSMLETLNHPVNTVHFFLTYLGAAFGFGDRYVAAIFGLIFLGIFGFFLTYSLRKLLVDQNETVFRNSLPWLTIGSYAILSGLLTTLGRAGFGIPTALAPKYVTFSTFLPIALLHGLGLMIAVEPIRLKHSQTFKKLGLSLAGLLIIGYLLTFAYGMRGLKANYQTRIFAKACLMLINVSQEVDCVEAYNSLYPIRGIVKERSNLLQEPGLLRPPLEDTSFYNNSLQISEPSVDHGTFESFTFDDSGNFQAVGWAILPKKKAPADAVLLTYTLPTGELRLLQVVRPGILRQDIADAVGNPYRRSGWQATVLKDTIPPEAMQLNAWAFDVAQKTAYRLGQDFPLK